MATTRPNRKPARFLWIFIAGVTAAILLSLAAGYMIGASNVGVGQLNDTQDKFVKGVAQGGIFQGDYLTWRDMPDKEKSIKDVRAFPETRCASEFYPQNPIAMSGCLQGINPPTNDQYFIPVIKG
jgi:hypothetical protein